MLNSDIPSDLIAQFTDLSIKAIDKLKNI